MSPAVGVGHTFQFPLQDVVLLKAVRYQHSVIVFVVLQRKLMITPVLVLVQDDRPVMVVFAGSVNPHVVIPAEERFFPGLRVTADYQQRRFIRLGHRQGEKLLLHPLTKRAEVFRKVKHPVAHRLPGDMDLIAFQLLGDPVQRQGVDILAVNDRGPKGRRHNAFFDQVFRPVTAQEFILVVSFGADIDVNDVVFHGIGRRLAAQLPVVLLRHLAPAALTIESIQLFFRDVMDMRLGRESGKIFIPLAFLLLAFIAFDRFLDLRLGSFGIRTDFGFVKQAELAVNGVQPLRFPPETVRVGNTDLLDQALHLVVQTADLLSLKFQLSLLVKYDLGQ